MPADQASLDPFLHDGIVIAGDLIPNSELAVAAGLQVRQPDRVPLQSNDYQLSSPGWFVAGAEVGGFLGAAACYREGQRAASLVAQFLRRGR